MGWFWEFYLVLRNGFVDGLEPPAGVFELVSQRLKLGGLGEGGGAVAGGEGGVGCGLHAAGGVGGEAPAVGGFKGGQAGGEVRVGEGGQEQVALRGGDQGAVVEGQEGRGEQDGDILGQITGGGALPVDQAEALAMADEIGGGGVGVNEAEGRGLGRAGNGAAGVQAAGDGVGRAGGEVGVGLGEDGLSRGRDGAEAGGVGSGLAAEEIGSGGDVALPFGARDIAVDQDLLGRPEADEVGGYVEALEPGQGEGFGVRQVGEQAVVLDRAVAFEDEVAVRGGQVLDIVPEAGGEGPGRRDLSAGQVAGHEGLHLGQGPGLHRGFRLGSGQFAVVGRGLLIAKRRLGDKGTRKHLGRGGTARITGGVVGVWRC